jgi:hypothetical protein
MNSNPSPHAGRRLYFSRNRASVKKPFAHAIGLYKVVGIFEKFYKK